MAFDLFLVWLGEDEPMPPEDFVSLFRDWYYKATRVQCGLLERDARKRENIVPYSPEEPARKKHSREKRPKKADME